MLMQVALMAGSTWKTTVLITSSMHACGLLVLLLPLPLLLMRLAVAQQVLLKFIPAEHFATALNVVPGPSINVHT